jgi:hypothetical protein
VCRSGGRLAQDVKVLAHESQHLRGITDEATAECYGIQETAFTARDLGASRAEADAMARYVWLALRYMPPAYVSDECRPGGKLDLRPDTPTWPSS